MLIEIKHWYGNVLHTIEADSIKAAVEALVKQEADLRGADLGGADLRGADLLGADLREAYLGGADLRGAYLREANLEEANLRGAYLGGANLEEANLRGAYLGGADLREAKYGDDIPLTKTPIYISGLKWDVMILDTYLRIGCELHSFEEWDLEGDKIAKQHDETKWWKQHKGAIFALIKTCR